MKPALVGIRHLTSTSQPCQLLRLSPSLSSGSNEGYPRVRDLHPDQSRNHANRIRTTRESPCLGDRPLPSGSPPHPTRSGSSRSVPRAPRSWVTSLLRSMPSRPPLPNHSAASATRSPWASPEPGQTVLDLGCGAGFDTLLAARRVGPNGKVIGVDMTPEMIAKARHNASLLGVTNVEFLLGEIESLPLARRLGRSGDLQRSVQPLPRQAEGTGRGLPGLEVGRSAPDG